jgi:hypothetical protein
MFPTSSTATEVAPPNLTLLEAAELALSLLQGVFNATRETHLRFGFDVTLPALLPIAKAIGEAKTTAMMSAFEPSRWRPCPAAPEWFETDFIGFLGTHSLTRRVIIKGRGNFASAVSFYAESQAELDRKVYTYISTLAALEAAEA